MPSIVHPATGIVIGDPDICPLTGENLSGRNPGGGATSAPDTMIRKPVGRGRVQRALPDSESIREAFSSLILSASGWRKVFASPRAGEDWAPWIAAEARSAEDSLSPFVCGADLVLAGAMAMVYAGFIRKKSASDAPAILVGIDSRPTGPALADIMLRVLVAMGIRPRYLFVVAAPEIMALDRHGSSLPVDHPDRTEGFVYISASHNPPGHNGVKFGSGGGGVLAPTEIAPLIAEFRSLAIDPELPARVKGLVRKVSPREIARIFVETSSSKRKAISAYTLLAREIITGLEVPDEQEAFFDAMMPASEESACGVVADLNGSARALSIDSDFLHGMGVKVKAVNTLTGCFAHRIVPEGESLDECARELESAHLMDPCYILGYTPDCDGDRGNLVWYDPFEGRARILEAQQVFALCCIAELASLVRNASLAGTEFPEAAVAVNDATSMRIESIARRFGARVFRAETGEANVVGLASRLREGGFVVRILGEGSNGGNITHPSRVRDPLATLGAVLKLLSLRDGADSDGLYHIWMRLSGQEEHYDENFMLGDIIASLPAFATTSVFEPRAALKVKTADKSALKARYAAIFAEEWQARIPELRDRYSIESWKAFASNGSNEREIGIRFADSGSGGLRITFDDVDGAMKAMLWMRGSGTEAVFRILADVAGGGAADEEYFLSWHRAMVEKADNGSD